MVRKVYQAFQAVQVFPEHQDPRVLVVLMDCPVTRVRRGLLAGLATAVQLELLERLVIRDSVSYTHLTLPTIYSV